MFLRLIIFCALFLSVRALSAQTQNCLQNVNHPGFNSMSQVIGSDTILREYVLYVPSSYDANTPTPLIISYHGFGGCAADFESYVGQDLGLNALADQEQFIVAYAQGAYRPEKEDVYWEPGDTGVEDIYKNDCYFTEQLIQDIANSYNVNTDRVYTAGYSNGGMMSYSVACNRGDLIAGAAVMSGAFLDGDCVANVHTPIIIFHGVGDFVLPYEGNQFYSSVAETVDYWLGHNGIPASSLVSTQLNGNDVLRESYSGGNDNTCLTFFTIYEEYGSVGGHVWFSEAINGSTPNEILWDFFSSNCSVVNTDQAPDRRKELNISPNPFIDQLHVSGENLKGKSYKVFNSLGEQVQFGSIDSDEFILKMDSLSAGIYYFEVEGAAYRIIRMQ